MAETSMVRRVWVCALVVACLVLGVPAPIDAVRSQAPLASGAQAVRDALDAGTYQDAERLASAWVTGVARDHGTDSLEAARAADLLVEALVKNGKAGANETLELTERVVRLKERRLGTDDPDLASSLDSLGVVRTERGEMAAAVPLLERAVAIRRQALAPDDPTVADGLDDLALALILLQRFQDAERALAESRRIRETERGASALALGRTLFLVALLHRYDGRYPEADRPLARALDIRQRELPRDHPDVRSAIQLRGELSFLQGNIDAARRDWSTALDIEERTLRPGHPDIAITLRLLAVAATAFGDLKTARELLERALPLAQQSLAPCHQEIPNLQGDYASAVMYDGDYLQAQALYATALATHERCFPPNDQRTATVIHNQAQLAAAMGDLPRAERLHERAIAMWTEGLGPDHPYVARGIDALAAVVAAGGQYAKARALYERALAMRRRTLGPDHPDVAWTLTNLAQVIGASGDARGALQRVAEAIETYQRVGVGDEPDDLARALVLRGTLESKLGDFSSARATFVEALGLRERVFGSTHPLTAEVRSDIATTDFALASYDAALDAALDAERSGRDHLRFTIRYLPERQALLYADKRPRGLDLALSIVAAGHAGDSSPVLDSVIQSRGVILDELGARARSAQGSDPELAPLRTAVAGARERFANLMLRSLEQGEHVSRSLLDEARQRKEDAERALAERSRAARTESARARIGLTEIRRALPPASALISFVRYDRTSVTGTQAGGMVSDVAPAYVAFVISPAAEAVVAVPLGPAAEIETTISTWRREVDGRSLAAGSDAGEAERAYRVAATRLRQEVWDPLAGQLGGAAHVFIVPDGALNLVSFAALPVDESRYLVETGPVMHLLSTERDLVPEPQPPSGHGLLAAGGPAYDLETSRPVSLSTRRAGCDGLGQLRFEDLPGSRAEVQDISRIWSAASGTTPNLASGAGVTVLSGSAATKREFVDAAAGRRVVHLATHGFFLDSPCASGPRGTRAVGGLSSVSSRRTLVEGNPLLFAGLAFAGANRRADARPGHDDGILTAEEVASLNLQGTEWAVLSACDTGLGQIKAGEGVFGLRRAFQIAGVRTVIMSLWSVDDQSTRDWMRALYEGRISQGLSTADAVHRASLGMLDARRTRGQSTHPFYWAAFVAAGDWK